MYRNRKKTEILNLGLFSMHDELGGNRTLISGTGIRRDIHYTTSPIRYLV